MLCTVTLWTVDDRTQSGLLFHFSRQIVDVPELSDSPTQPIDVARPGLAEMATEIALAG